MLNSQLQNIKNELNSYDKPHLNFNEQLDKLKKNGLSVHNDTYAINKLSHINYYRLSAYFLPFQYPKSSDKKDTFFEDATFTEISKLYDFDAKLRRLVFGAIETVEVYARTQIAYYHSQEYGTFGYLKKENFDCSEEDFEKLILDIKEESKRSDESFVKHFQKKYNTTDLPLWSVVEVLSFGTLSRLFTLLKPKDKKLISSKVNLHPKVFQNWLHALSILRNICAHHSRLWNKQLRIRFKVPSNDTLFNPLKQITKTHNIGGEMIERTYDNNASVFFALSILKYMLDSIGEEVDFLLEVKQLLGVYPNVNLIAMGFVEDWDNCLLWSDV